LVIQYDKKFTEERPIEKIEAILKRRELARQKNDKTKLKPSSCCCTWQLMKPVTQVLYLRSDGCKKHFDGLTSKLRKVNISPSKAVPFYIGAQTLLVLQNVLDF